MATAFHNPNAISCFSVTRAYTEAVPRLNHDKVRAAAVRLQLSHCEIDRFSVASVSSPDCTSSSERDHPMLAVSLLIADDHEVVRRGIRALIQEQPGWQIAAEVKDGRDAVAKADQFKPDVAILDIIMPSLNGLDAAKQIAKISPGTKILILTMHESDQLIHKILDAGARGYILKTDAGRDLIMAVKALLSNKTFFLGGSGRT
jgi:CheY-like chemotaxis protein